MTDVLHTHTDPQLWSTRVGRQDTGAVLPSDPANVTVSEDDNDDDNDDMDDDDEDLYLCFLQGNLSS